eukprot:4332708-Amphidinium_carterae.1
MTSLSTTSAVRPGRVAPQSGTCHWFLHAPLLGKGAEPCMRALRERIGKCRKKDKVTHKSIRMTLSKEVQLLGKVRSLSSCTCAPSEQLVPARRRRYPPAPMDLLLGALPQAALRARVRNDLQANDRQAGGPTLDNPSMVVQQCRFQQHHCGASAILVDKLDYYQRELFFQQQAISPMVHVTAMGTWAVRDHITLGQIWRQLPSAGVAVLVERSFLPHDLQCGRLEQPKATAVCYVLFSLIRASKR